MLSKLDLEAIWELIGKNEIVRVEAPSGAGSNVWIPRVAVQKGLRCFVSVPSGALMLAEYQNIWAEGKLQVGFGAEGQVYYDENTYMAYITSDHARRKMLSYWSNGAVSPFNFCDILIVDETIPGSIDHTVVLALWMKASRTSVKRPKLVILSTGPITISSNPTISSGSYVAIPKTYPITYNYANRNPELEGDLYTITAQTTKQINDSSPTGNILIFTPEVGTMLNVLKQFKFYKTPDFIPIVGAISQETIIKLSTRTFERKIIIATEMPLPIDDIGYVIDTMAEKRPMVNANGGVRVVSQYIAKDTALQRAGRTGYLRSGICYRMCTMNLYEQLNQQRPTEVSYLPLYGAITELMAVQLDPRDIFTTVDITRIQQARDLVVQLGLVVDVDDNYIITEAGQFAPYLSLSLRNAVFLWKWITYKGLRFNDKLISEAEKLQNMNWNFLEIDKSSEYSSLSPYQIPKVDAIFAIEQVNPHTIIDATANIGGDSINFMKLYPYADLTSLELDPNIASILRRNLENLPNILNTKHVYNTRAINISALEYFASPRYAELIYFDPPWGGKDYHMKHKISLTLDNQPIGILIGHILAAGMTPLVVLKAPYNVDFVTLYKDIESQVKVTHQVHDVVNDVLNQVDYKLIFIRPQEVQYQLPSMGNSFPEVVLTPPPSYPVGPGIAIAALIDSYTPSYFDLPRKDRNQSIQDYTKRIQEKFAEFIGYNDLETCMNMWNQLIIIAEKKDESALRTWVNQKSLNYKKIKELLNLVDQITRTLMQMDYTVQPGPFETRENMTLARPLLQSVYNDRVLLQAREPGSYFNQKSPKDRYKLDNKGINQFYSKLPLGVIALVVTEIQHLKIITFAVDTDRNAYGKPIIPRETERGDTAIRRVPKTDAAVPITQVPNSGVPDIRVPPTPAQNALIMSGLELIKRLNLENKNPAKIEKILEPWIRHFPQPRVPYVELADLTADDIIPKFKQFQVEFPFLRGYHSAYETQTGLVELYSYNEPWQTSPYDTGYNLHSMFKTPGTDSEMYIWSVERPNTIDWIADYFTERNKLQCIRSDNIIKLSPLDAWNNFGAYSKDAITSVLDSKQDLTLENLHQALYSQQVIKVCPGISVTFLTSILKALGISNPRIFEGHVTQSQGLISAMALGSPYYTGINANTHFLDEVIDLFGPMILEGADSAIMHSLYKIVASPNEAENGTFDISMLFYPDDTKIPDTNEILSCWNMIRPGGYLLLKIGDIMNTAAYMFSYFPDSFLCGPITRETSVWVWCKIDYTLLTPLQQSLVNTYRSQLTYNVPKATVSLNKEYVRYLYVREMETFLTKNVSRDQVIYEVLNALERWLLALANSPGNYDAIFKVQHLEVNAEPNTKFLEELNDKRIPLADALVNGCISLVNSFNALTTFPDTETPVIQDNTIRIGTYTRILSQDRMDLLLTKGTKYDIAAMCLRYSCLLPRGQQWNIPIIIYQEMVNKYGIEIEGFASPINSQIIRVNPDLKFCSLFPDTDAIFGSIGQFFDQKFDNVKVMANPPYVLSIMNTMADFIAQTFNRAHNLFFVITLPAWTDADAYFYHTLKTNPYTKRIIELSINNHYYVDSNNEEKKILAKFNSLIIIMSKGYPDLDYELMETDIKALYSLPYNRTISIV